MEVKVFSASVDAETIKTVNDLKEILIKKGFKLNEKSPDLVISVGGDGTFLSAIHDQISRLSSVFFVGIHTGHLGFFADWLSNESEILIDNIKNQNINYNEYRLLEAKIEIDDKVLMLEALNEISLRRISNSLSASVMIDEQTFENFRGDGIVISTPIGSTAYNKSVGGAVIDSRIDALQLAEIASINNNVYRTLGSPMLLAPDSKIKITAEVGEFEITYDNLNFPIDNMKNIELNLSDKSVRVINFKNINFWERVQKSFIGDLNK